MEFNEPSNAVPDLTLAGETGTEIAVKGTTPESGLSSLSGANTNQPPILPPVQYSRKQPKVLDNVSTQLDPFRAAYLP
jgi:hypothetical protein